jgi:hypothetical protein
MMKHITKAYKEYELESFKKEIDRINKLPGSTTLMTGINISGVAGSIAGTATGVPMYVALNSASSAIALGPIPAAFIAGIGIMTIGVLITALAWKRET